MSVEIRALTQAERLYASKQSQQISMSTNFIGSLRVDMGESGKEFLQKWDSFHDNLNTPDFTEALDAVLGEMRDYGGILSSRGSLLGFCNRSSETLLNQEMNVHGVRIDRDKYAFLFRLNPNPDAYNINCFCYGSLWLDRHISQAEKGIRFITSDYNEIFRIPDGDQIRIIRSDGVSSDHRCRYIDDYHVEIGDGWDNLFHICQFAEQMERCQNKVIPLRSSLPEYCHTYLPTTGEIGIIKKGEKGYHRTDISPVFGQEKEFVSEINRERGITKAQEEAMRAGSMFGWECLAADPRCYDENGHLMKPQKNKDQAR